MYIGTSESQIFDKRIKFHFRNMYIFFDNQFIFAELLFIYRKYLTLSSDILKITRISSKLCTKLQAS